MEEKKPALKSTGVWANGLGSIFFSVLAALQVAGVHVPAITPDDITSIVSAGAVIVGAATNIIGLFGRIRAKSKIVGIVASS